MQLITTNGMRIKNNFKSKKTKTQGGIYSFHNKGTFSLFKTVKITISNYFKNQRMKKIIEI